MQSYLQYATSTRFLLQALGTFSVLVFYVSLDWTLPGLVWGLTISQFYFGLAIYVAWWWPGLKGLIPFTIRDIDDPEKLLLNLPFRRHPYHRSVDISESFLVNLMFTLLIYGGCNLMMLGYWFGLFPLTSSGVFVDSLVAANEIYWPVIITTFITHIRYLPWGQQHKRSNKGPMRDISFPVPPPLLVSALKAPLLVILCAVIVKLNLDIYGPIVLLIAAIFFFDPTKWALEKSP